MSKPVVPSQAPASVPGAPAGNRHVVTAKGPGLGKSLCGSDPFIQNGGWDGIKPAETAPASCPNWTMPGCHNG